jgi:hypothetical protein
MAVNAWFIGSCAFVIVSLCSIDMCQRLWKRIRAARVVDAENVLSSLASSVEENLPEASVDEPIHTTPTASSVPAGFVERRIFQLSPPPPLRGGDAHESQDTTNEMQLCTQIIMI